MQAFTSTELSRMQSAQEAAMQDTCVVQVYSESADAYNNPEASYADGSAIDCGVEHVNPDEVQESGEVPTIDVRIRLPLDTTIDVRDRIKVTHRYGSALATAQVFEIEGPVQRGPSGLVVGCRKVTKE